MVEAPNKKTENLSPKKEGAHDHMQDLEIDLRNFLLVLWRRKLLILFVMLVCVGTVFYYVSSVQPRYTAKALVIIENRSDPGPELRALISNMRIDTTLILGEAEVLKSRTLARKVIDRLGLMNDPEFNPRLRVKKDNIIDNIFSDEEQKKSFKTLSIYGQKMTNVPLEVSDADVGLVVDRFLKQIYARPIPGSFVLQVEFTSDNPKKAALITNAIVDTYIDQRLNQKFQAAQKLSEWLDGRLESLRQQVRDSEGAVEDFRADNNLMSGARTEVRLKIFKSG